MNSCVTPVFTNNPQVVRQTPYISPPLSQVTPIFQILSNPPPPYNCTHVIPSAPPLPNNLTTSLDRGIDIKANSLLGNIKYNLERELFKLLQEDSFGLYPNIIHSTILENKVAFDNPDTYFLKLHLEISSCTSRVGSSHCVHIRIKKTLDKFILERVLPHMTETDELGFLSVKSI